MENAENTEEYGEGENIEEYGEGENTEEYGEGRKLWSNNGEDGEDGEGENRAHFKSRVIWEYFKEY